MATLDREIICELARFLQQHSVIPQAALEDIADDLSIPLYSEHLNSYAATDGNADCTDGSLSITKNPDNHYQHKIFYYPGLANQPDQILKDHFINNHWQPFLEKLSTILLGVQIKVMRKFSLTYRFPQQTKIIQLQNQCLHLTEVWYGKDNGNISVFYNFFIKMLTIGQLSFYQYENLKTFQSKDCFLSRIDAQYRNASIKAYPYQQEIIIPTDAPAIDDLNYAKLIKHHAPYILFMEYIKIVTVKLINLYHNPEEPKQLGHWEELPHNVKRLIINEFQQKKYFRHQQYNISHLNQNIEQLHYQRYLCLPWKRKIHSCYTTAGATECCKIRINQMPYKPTHGISIADSNCHNYLSNHLKDVEKLLTEVKLLNPDITAKHQLPEEKYFDMLQNTIAESSIPEILHSHISSFTIVNYPLFQRIANPVFHPLTNASWDLVASGTTTDAIFVKITTADITNTNLLQYLTALILHLQQLYGSEQHIDFYLHAIPARNFFVIILQPLAPLKRLHSNLYKNLDTQRTMHKLGTPIYRGRDLGTLDVDGKQHLAAFYDFAAKHTVSSEIVSWLYMMGIYSD